MGLYYPPPKKKTFIELADPIPLTLFRLLSS